MAGVIPSFITGANAKIKIGTLTMAFAADVSYQIVTGVLPVRTMGVVETIANEPVSYSVSGSFSVIRYTENAASDKISTNEIKVTQTTDEDGNISTSTQVISKPGTSAIPGSNSAGNSINQWKDTSSGNVGKQLNPGAILQSATFDIEIYSKHRSGTAQSELVLKLRDCRITGKSGSLSKRGLMVDNFSFSALLVDNDDAVAVSKNINRDLSLGKSKLGDIF